MFKKRYYKQVDGVAMGSPLGQPHIFICSFGSKWLRNYANDFKPVFYRRYIYDIFVLFSSPDHADKFREYLLSKHPNIKFSIQKEEDGRLPFLDINIFRENDKFATTSIEKRPSVGLIPTSQVLNLIQIKLVQLNHYYFGVSVSALIFSNFIMSLIN